MTTSLSSLLESDGEIDCVLARSDKLEEMVVSKDICVECESHNSEVFCEQCHEYVCTLCFEGLHRKGNRSKHTFQPIVKKEDMKSTSVDDTLKNTKKILESLLMRSPQKDLTSGGDLGDMLERAKFIPIRLTYEDRMLLRMLEAALAVCDYTNKLDQDMSAGKRLRMQLQEICGFLSGLVVASEYTAGQTVLSDTNFVDSMEFFKEIFELGRRYKIMNPEKMRGEYGKLMYLLQDANIPQLEELLGFSLMCEIKTVYTVLGEHDCLNMLKHPQIHIATKVVEPEGKSRSEIKRDIKMKELAVKRISKEYSRVLDEEDIQQCLHSIADNNYHLYFERDPINHVIDYLKKYFKPNDVGDDAYSLAIVSGQDGARLSHSHERQYHYVLQSLTLWKEIVQDMFKLWYLADQDLLTTGNSYELVDTGQGLHRIQSSPKVSRAMHVILHSTQRKLEHWVGSSVIHLGDKNVPNGLMFIDKYTQVGYILRPIVKTLMEIDRLHTSSPGIRYYIDNAFHGKESLKKEILTDFFTEAFDGSGADNFFDAGSCIDGRLTSAWNWCSRLQEKRFYSFFKLSGFIGFDGKFV